MLCCCVGKPKPRQKVRLSSLNKKDDRISRNDDYYQRRDQLYSKIIYYASKKKYIADWLFYRNLCYVLLSIYEIMIPFVEYAVDVQRDYSLNISMFMLGTRNYKNLPCKGINVGPLLSFWNGTLHSLLLDVKLLMNLRMLIDQCLRFCWRNFYLIFFLWIYVIFYA